MSSALMLLALFSVQDRTEFAVGDWTRFAGREFGGVVLQESTDSDLKKRFRTERGAFRPEGLVLASRDARVEALLDGRGGQARAIGLWIDFRGRGPSVRETLEGMAEPGALRYPRSRYSDWSVHTFAERGLAVFTVEDRVDVALLTTPDRLRRLSEGLQGEPSRIDDLQVWFDRLDSYGSHRGRGREYHESEHHDSGSGRRRARVGATGGSAVRDALDSRWAW